MMTEGRSLLSLHSQVCRKENSVAILFFIYHYSKYKYEEKDIDPDLEILYEPTSPDSIVQEGRTDNQEHDDDIYNVSNSMEDDVYKRCRRIEYSP